LRIVKTISEESEGANEEEDDSDDEDDDESDGGRKAKKHTFAALLILLFLSLHDALTQAAESFASGVASGITARSAASSALTDHHTRAAALGTARAAAGTHSSAPPAKEAVTTADAALGKESAKAQLSYFDGFLDAIALGKYEGSETGIAARAALYGGALLTTATAAWLAALPQNTRLTWRAEPGACLDCQVRNGKTYLIAELPGIPADGSTRCGSQCRCFLVTSDGETSFEFS